MPRAYGVLGLASPLEDVSGPDLPVYTEAVLLPFEGRIINDSLLRPSNMLFGRGIRRSLSERYEAALEEAAPRRSSS